VVFQEPMSALHPAKRVGNQVAEGVRAHGNISHRAAFAEAVRLLDLVGIPDAATRARSYPHELSGGLQQRVAIAIALAGKPALLIADEPTTALDTTVQAQVMTELRTLRRELGLSVLFISHDLALIAELADRTAIMYAGRVVEEAPIVSLFEHPEHPYTESLLAAATRSAMSGTAAGEGPSGPEYCPYLFRCPYREDDCGHIDPPLVARSAGGGTVRCLRQGRISLSGVGTAPDLEVPV
jgi:peptide/nickel transport system ATP-binding protein